MVTIPTMDPYFIYYENEDYYNKMSIGVQAIVIL
jgi:hypothetical protein